MRKYLLYFLLLSSIIFVSCEKDGLDLGGLNFTGFTITFNSSTFDSNAIKIIKLPVGRYFIYKDQTSGFTDSVLVTQSLDSFGFQSVGPGYPVSYFYSIFKLTLTSFSGATPHTWFNGTTASDFPPYSGTTTISVVDSNFQLSNEQLHLSAFWYPLQSAGLMQYTFYPSMTVEGNNYSSIHQFSVTNGLLPSDPNFKQTLFFWVKEIGIIKRVITTGTYSETALLMRYGKI